MRPVEVKRVLPDASGLRIETPAGSTRARAVISATGTWQKPFIPAYPDSERFRGTSLHSVYYRSPEPFAGQRVLIVGAGNSGAQILAELSKVAHTTWVSLHTPAFHPDEVDGRVLFDRATAQYQGVSPSQTGGLGAIVMVPSVKEARARGVLQAEPPFERFSETGVVWSDGRALTVDAVIWCTGFRPALDHLRDLGVLENERVLMEGTRALEEPRLWLVGYGAWTGFASATLVGVGRSAKATVTEVVSFLGNDA